MRSFSAFLSISAIESIPHGPGRLLSTGLMPDYPKKAKRPGDFPALFVMLHQRVDAMTEGPALNSGDHRTTTQIGDELNGPSHLTIHWFANHAQIRGPTEPRSRIAMGGRGSAFFPFDHHPSSSSRPRFSVFFDKKHNAGRWPGVISVVVAVQPFLTETASRRSSMPSRERDDFGASLSLSF